MGQDHSAIPMERQQGGLLNDIYRCRWAELCHQLEKTFGPGPPRVRAGHQRCAQAMPGRSPVAFIGRPPVRSRALTLPVPFGDSRGP